MLHSAVTTKSDSIPVLLAKGVNVVALDSKGRSALQLACLYCDADTVQLLLNGGTWLHSLGTACMLNATIAGNAAVLAKLLEHSADCSCAIAESGCTLLHAAAAYGRLACAGLLLQHGCDAKTLSRRVSTVEAAFAPELTPSLQRRGIERPAWSARRATAMLMLQHGAAYDVKRIAASKEYAALVKQYMDGLKQQSAQQLALLQLHAANTCGTTITTATSSSSGRGGGSSSSSSSSSGGSTAKRSVVKVQLVNADTGKRSRRVYTLNTAVLSRLHREEA
jgi:Ankyrin repeat